MDSATLCAISAFNEGGYTLDTCCQETSYRTTSIANYIYTENIDQQRIYKSQRTSQTHVKVKRSGKWVSQRIREEGGHMNQEGFNCFFHNLIWHTL